MSSDYRLLVGFLRDTRKLTVLTGAGVSTGSGIPDYRDHDGRSKVKTPIQLPDFVRRPQVQQRYWARSFIGWQRFSKAEPNAAHRALASLETANRIDRLVTQNVDGLHQEAGSKRVIDLHGRLDAVICMHCKTVTPREEFQAALEDANPTWHAEVFAVNPDGDAELAEANVNEFTVPACGICGGIVKPDVVMFGENVPKPRVTESMASVERSDGLLIVGSSLMVYSGLRFARQAAEIGKPIVIVNQGRTRADDLALFKLQGDCGELLSAVVQAS